MNDDKENIGKLRKSTLRLLKKHGDKIGSAQVFGEVIFLLGEWVYNYAPNKEQAENILKETFNNGWDRSKNTCFLSSHENSQKESID